MEKFIGNFYYFIRVFNILGVFSYFFLLLHLALVLLSRDLQHFPMFFSVFPGFLQAKSLLFREKLVKFLINFSEKGLTFLRTSSFSSISSRFLSKSSCCLRRVSSICAWSWSFFFFCDSSRSCACFTRSISLNFCKRAFSCSFSSSCCALWR